MIRVTTANSRMGADRATVQAAALRLAGRLWSVTAEDVVVQSDDCLTHGVRVDGDTACWLTWQLETAEDGRTEVRLIHDELGDGAPEPDLDRLLVLLSLTVKGEPSTAG